MVSCICRGKLVLSFSVIWHSPLEKYMYICMSVYVYVYVHVYVCICVYMYMEYVYVCIIKHWGSYQESGTLPSAVAKESGTPPSCSLQRVG